jgi:hypothetical protein
MKSQDVIVLKDGDTINIATRQFVYHGNFSHIGQKSVRRAPSIDPCPPPPMRRFSCPKGETSSRNLHEQQGITTS